MLDLRAIFMLVNMLSSRVEVEETIDKLGLHIDAKEWSELEEILAENVEIDYRSLNGGNVETLFRPDVIARWKSMLTPLRTQHIITNMHITIKPDNTAECAANLMATHVRPNGGEDSIYTIGGRYDFHLAQENGRWRIYAIRLTALWTTGNPKILNQTVRQ
ncbi:MAG TPA: nuclear transport factor 2 family protein [Candidatus Nanoarchaeia archaeon]|nr:nuclear transport factor 2 family protein [Candidatus Nanoarchaeia archaeon]